MHIRIIDEKYKAEFAERLKTPTLSRAPTVKIDGVDHPYFAVNMSYGTLCDINQRPRNTQVSWTSAYLDLFFLCNR